MESASATFLDAMRKAGLSRLISHEKVEPTAHYRSRTSWI